MKTFLTFQAVVLLFVLVRAADLAISAAIGHQIIRAVCYGIVAVLTLLVVILTLIGV